MELDDLKVFTEVAKLKSISHAATRLYLTQPTVSKKIKRLENEIGAQLFVRTRNGVELTQSGNIFYSYASTSYTEIIQGMTKAKTASTDEIIKIASPASYASSLFSELIPLLENQSVVYEFYHYHSNEIIDLVGEHVIDIGLFEAERELVDTDVIIKPLFNDPIVACCSINHSISQKEPVTLKELENENIALFSWGQDFQQFTQILSEQNLSTKNFRRFSPISIVKELILENQYISFLPLSLIQKELKINQLKTISVEDFPSLSYKLSLAYRPEITEQIDIQQFIDKLNVLSNNFV